jgi:hypothetical protein
MTKSNPELSSTGLGTLSRATTNDLDSDVEWYKAPRTQHRISRLSMSTGKTSLEPEIDKTDLNASGQDDP